MSNPRALNTVELYQLHIFLVSFYYFLDNIFLHFTHLFTRFYIVQLVCLNNYIVSGLREITKALEEEAWMLSL